MRAKGALVLPMERGARARYTLSLMDVRVSGSGSANSTFASLKLPTSTYAPTLVDSGTTFVYASTPLFRAIHAHVKAHTPTLTAGSRSARPAPSARGLGGAGGLHHLQVGHVALGAAHSPDRPLAAQPSLAAGMIGGSSRAGLCASHPSESALSRPFSTEQLRLPSVWNSTGSSLPLLTSSSNASPRRAAAGAPLLRRSPLRTADRASRSPGPRPPLGVGL